MATYFVCICNFYSDENYTIYQLKKYAAELPQAQEILALLRRMCKVILIRVLLV